MHTSFLHRKPDFQNHVISTPFLVKFPLKVADFTRLKKAVESTLELEANISAGTSGLKRAP